MTPERKAELRALCEAATPGPWEAYWAPCCPDMGGVTGPRSKVMAACVGRFGHPASIEDAEFIATARNELPALLDALDAAERRATAYEARAAKLEADLAAALEVTPRRFPLQVDRKDPPGSPDRIPWAVAELAYAAYSARYGRHQSLEVLASRGGFGVCEMDELLPDWRDRIAPQVEIERLRAEVATATKAGFEIAERHAWISEHDGWVRTAPQINWTLAERALADALAAKGGGS